MWNGGSLGKRSCRSLAYVHASCSTQRPIATIRPVSSASGMKSSGGTMPRSGWIQRISASTPEIRPDSSSITGW